MPRADLQVWAQEDYIEPLYLTPNKHPIPLEIQNKGWLIGTPVTGQHLNKIFNEITYTLKVETLEPALNLSDVPNKATARTNLDVLQKSVNLSDVPNKATARDNLGLNIDNLFNTFFDKVYPVGTIYENKTNSANPNTYLGRGTWVVEGAGRVSVGVGSGTDVNSTVQAFAAAETGGEYTHGLTSAENAPHTHPYRDRYYVEVAATVAAAANKEGTPTNYNGKLGGSGTDTDNDTFLYIDSTTSSSGSGTRHNNVQPYTTVYRWVRTA